MLLSVFRQLSASFHDAKRIIWVISFKGRDNLRILYLTLLEEIDDHFVKSRAIDRGLLALLLILLTVEVPGVTSLFAIASRAIIVIVLSHG